MKKAWEQINMALADIASSLSGMLGFALVRQGGWEDCIVFPEICLGSGSEFGKGTKSI